MKKIEITPFELAQRFIGLKEMNGIACNPMILAMLRLDETWPENDEVPWCSAFVNYICWLLRLPRSKNLRARSWLQVGQSVDIYNAQVGFDIVILQRGKGVQPGAEVINAPGHVGFFAGLVSRETIVMPEGRSVKTNYVSVLGGNQSDSVNISQFHTELVLGVRRLII